MFEWVASPEAWIALATLISLEIVLGIDNIIFISVLVGKLPEGERDKARKIGISLAMLARLALLFSIVWVMALVEPIFSVFENEISGRDIILLIGGLFLLGKATHEIHDSLEIIESPSNPTIQAQFYSVLAQIAALDIVFSLDSVITAVGLVEHISIMVIAIVISVFVMLFSAKTISQFVENNPTIKILALSFLILIGVTLIAEGLNFHIPKGYIYFAMAFSVVVELINIKIHRKKMAIPIQLNKKISS